MLLILNLSIQFLPKIIKKGNFRIKLSILIVISSRYDNKIWLNNRSNYNPLLLYTRFAIFSYHQLLVSKCVPKNNGRVTCNIYSQLSVKKKRMKKLWGAQVRNITNGLCHGLSHNSTNLLITKLYSIRIGLLWIMIQLRSTRSVFSARFFNWKAENICFQQYLFP